MSTGGCNHDDTHVFHQRRCLTPHFVIRFVVTSRMRRQRVARTCAVREHAKAFVRKGLGIKVDAQEREHNSNADLATKQLRAPAAGNRSKSPTANFCVLVLVAE